METVKLSSKGQIVISKAILDDLHLPPGTEFFINTTATGLTLTPKTTLFPVVKAREVRGILARKDRTLPDDTDIKARIKARLKAQYDASK